MDNQKWLLLNQLLEDLSDPSSKIDSEDSIRLVSQLVLELESELTSLKTGNLQRRLAETYLIDPKKGWA